MAYNLNYSHLPLLRSAVALKTSSFENMVLLVKTSCLATSGWGRPCLELFKKSPILSTCPCLTVSQLTGKAPFTGYCYHLALLGAQNFLCRESPVLRAFVKNNQWQLFNISAAERTIVNRKIRQ